MRRRIGSLALASLSAVASAMFVVAAMASQALAEGNGSCSATGSIAGCLGDRNGTIDVTGQLREKGNEGSSKGGEAASTQRNSEAQAMSAYCADAAANASEAGAAAAMPEIVPLCGFVGLPAAAAAPPTAVQVISAFRELALYRGAVRTDPERASLVNLETYFWCGDTSGRSCAAIGEGERTVTLLGQVVRIRPRIVSYDWRFGDGGGQRVTAGKAVHTYADPGIMPVSVTLTWTADYAVGGGQFQALGETTTTTSPIRLLPVREAEAVIVAGG
jgi:PKD domain